jgi:hypothetical protein
MLYASCLAWQGVFFCFRAYCRGPQGCHCLCMLPGTGRRHVFRCPCDDGLCGTAEKFSSHCQTPLNVGYNCQKRGVFLSMIHSLFAVVLLVGDLFHPFNVFPVERSRNGDMRHGGGG